MTAISPRPPQIEYSRNRTISTNSHSSYNSSLHSRDGGASAEPIQIPPPMPMSNGNGGLGVLQGSPVIGSPRILTPKMGASPRTGGRMSPGWDEVDRMAYIYSLRVATLDHRLAYPPSQTARNGSTSPTSLNRNNTNSPNYFGLPTPPSTGSPTEFKRFEFTTAPNSPNPNPSSPISGANGTSGSIKKKSGFFSRSPKTEQNGFGDPVKLPKEFLLEFWGVLAAEEGDNGWRSATSGFLGMIKKGSKTNSGMNLREIGTLLDAFTAVIPPQSPTCAPTHQHQTHLLKLLYNSLPRLSYFSPLARPQSEKDKDLCFRLRAEVQSYMLNSDPSADIPSPNPGETGTPTFPNGGLRPSALPSRSPALGRMPSQRSLGNGNPQGQGQEGKRKPSPVWLGGEDGSVGEMADLIGQVFGVGRDMLEKDVVGIKAQGNLEQMYMTELKQAMSALSAIPGNLTSSQKERQRFLSASVSALLRDFPDLAVPSSPDSNHIVSGGSFFTPPRKVEVYGRLTTKVSETTGHGTKSRDLVEKCRDLWGIANRKEREKEVETLVAAWSDSIGTQDEHTWGKSLAEGIRDLSFGLRPGEPLPPVMDNLLQTLLGLLSTSIVGIFPTTGSVPSPPPPPSLLPIINSAREIWLSQPPAIKKLGDLSDELKGSSVGEYVMAVHTMMGGVGGEIVPGKITETGKDQLVEGFENVAKWIEKEVGDVRKAWGNGLGSKLNPSAIILSKQLPLFLAELQVLDKPRGAPSDVFELYETTGRLISLWEDLCHGNEHGFELDAFFEPHVQAWLKDTEQNNATEWVSRSVGMDSWVPEGENKHSQSVIDLFEFVRESTQVILSHLPLTEYKRAMYLIDLSKTVSMAVTQYANTVNALFQSDLNLNKAGTPTQEIGNKFNDRIGGKAGSWLAKGQHAVKSFERKKVDGFIIPPVACVKLTDMGAARICIDDLLFAMEAEETARIVNAHKGKVNGHIANGNGANRYTFTVTIARGENILARSQNKGADGFVSVIDKDNGERLIKTRTILGTEDPKWEQSFDVAVGNMKRLEVIAYDRQLVGKHDPIGSATFTLNPKSFGECATRDILLPLTPRGMIYLRVSMDGGEKHDISYHLSGATRALDRTAEDMMRELVDKMAEFMKVQLSVNTLQNLTKVLRDKKKPRTTLSDAELEGSLGPLFEYLNENFSVFSVTLTAETRVELMLHLWRRTIEILISLLVPPLSDKPSTSPLLSPPEIDVVYKWLQMLKGYYNALENGVEHGVPMSELQKGAYKDIIMLGQYLDLPTMQLKERAMAAVKAAGRPPAATSPKIGMVGAMNRLAIGDNSSGEEKMAEVLLRIARTRPDTAEFLHTQITTLTRAKIERQAGILEGK